MQILAHRGASRDAPENTLRAFEEAVLQRADGVELDVQVCSSGEVVVCHDERLDRLAGVPWEVQRTPWWKLRGLDVATRLGFKTSQRIPLLEEVLEVLPPEMLVNVELKCERVDDYGLTARTVEVIRRCAATERVVVSSFNPLCLARLAALAPGLRRGYLIDPDRSFLLHGAILAPLVSRFSVHPYFGACSSARVARWRAAGYSVAVWTVDQPAEATRLRSLGVEYLITNRPGFIRSAFGGE